MILEHSADVIWALDLSTRRMPYVSPSVYWLCGVTPEAVLAAPLEVGRTLFFSAHMVADLDRRMAALQSGDATARIQTDEIDLLHQDDSIIPVEVVTTFVTDADGQGMQVVGVTCDIRQRRCREADLRHLTQQYQALTATTLDGYTTPIWRSWFRPKCARSPSLSWR